MNEATVEMFADAIEAHDGSDWYFALLMCTIDRCTERGITTPLEIIRLANEAFDRNPQPDTTPSGNTVEFGD